MKFKIKGIIHNADINDDFQIVILNSRTQTMLRSLYIKKPNDPRNTFKIKEYSGHFFMENIELIDVNLLNAKSGIVKHKKGLQPISNGSEWDSDEYLQVDFTL